MKQEFEVIEVENMRMRLAQPKQGCNHCSLNSGCGVGILGKYLSKPLYVSLQQGIKAGDSVSLEISNKTLFQHAFFLYILPLLVLFLVVFLAEYYSLREPWQVGLGLLSFSGYWIILKKALHR
jgi:sigma-E factor negative regulatory protein RseC